MQIVATPASLIQAVKDVPDNMRHTAKLFAESKFYEFLALSYRDAFEYSLNERIAMAADAAAAEVEFVFAIRKAA
jgi:hypothetical protein